MDALAAWLEASRLRDLAAGNPDALPLFAGIRVCGRILVGASGLPRHMDGGSIARLLDGYSGAT